MLRSIVGRGSTGGLVLEWIGYAALTLEVLAAVLIVIAVLVATARYALHFVNTSRNGHRAEQYKRDIAGGMMMALELLIAADVLRTITMDFALETIIVLGLLILIRTFLMWSLIVEIERRWPWQPRTADNLVRAEGEKRETENEH